MSVPRIGVGMLGDPLRNTLRDLGHTGGRTIRTVRGSDNTRTPDRVDRTYLDSLVNMGLASCTGSGFYELTVDGLETYAQSRGIYG